MLQQRLLFSSVIVRVHTYVHVCMSGGGELDFLVAFLQKGA